MKINNEIRVMLDQKTRDWLDSIEQCGYPVSLADGHFFIFDGEQLKAVFAPREGFWRTWTTGGGNIDHETADAARAEIIQWLEREHGCLEQGGAA
jgi:hypothetical protein